MTKNGGKKNIQQQNIFIFIFTYNIKIVYENNIQNITKNIFIKTAKRGKKNKYSIYKRENSFLI